MFCEQNYTIAHWAVSSRRIWLRAQHLRPLLSTFLPFLSARSSTFFLRKMVFGQFLSVFDKICSLVYFASRMFWENKNKVLTRPDKNGPKLDQNTKLSDKFISEYTHKRRITCRKNFLLWARQKKIWVSHKLREHFKEFQIDKETKLEFSKKAGLSWRVFKKKYRSVFLFFAHRAIKTVIKEF